MISNIIIRPDAEYELIEAYDWYETQKKGLGDKFISAIDNCIDSIIDNPEAYPIVHKKIRRALIGKFPFGIFYLFEQEKIIILAVFHLNRNPRVWKKRK